MGTVGVERDRTSIGIDCLLIFALVAVSIAQTNVRIGIVGVERDRTLVGVDCLLI